MKKMGIYFKKYDTNISSFALAFSRRGRIAVTGGKNFFGHARSTGSRILFSVLFFPSFFRVVRVGIRFLLFVRERFEKISDVRIGVRLHFFLEVRVLFGVIGPRYKHQKGPAVCLFGGVSLGVQDLTLDGGPVQIFFPPLQELGFFFWGLGKDFFLGF